MKRFFRFVFRLFIFAAIILLGVLLLEMQTLTTQVDELSTRVHGLEEANAARRAGGRAERLH